MFVTAMETNDWPDLYSKRSFIMMLKALNVLLRCVCWLWITELCVSLLLTHRYVLVIVVLTKFKQCCLVQAITAPTTQLSSIVIESYKKYVLVSLIYNGQVRWYRSQTFWIIFWTPFIFIIFTCDKFYCFKRRRFLAQLEYGLWDA